MKTALSFTVMLCGIVFATSASAVAIFTDRTTWQTAAGGGTGDIFVDFNGDAIDPLPFDAGPFTVSETGDGNAIISNGSGSDVNGTDFLYTSLDSSADNDTVTFSFDMPISALGFDLNPHNVDVGAIIGFITDIGDNGSYALPATDDTEFRGFLFDAPITSFTIDHASGGDLGVFGFHGIDDVEAFSSSGVPEPATLALMGLGLAGIGFARKKKPN